MIRKSFENTTCKEDVMIISEINDIFDEIVANRRWFHANPELSFQEFKTAAKVVELLKSYGITEIYENVGKTGVVGMIYGGQDGPCIALRADMDALPITETADVPYKSTNIGVQHACGHDGHCAGLLAAAKVLYNQRDQLKGSVKLIFQPAEEGYGGAREMIKDGVLNDGPFGPYVNEIYGIHLWSYDLLGSIGCQSGPIMAASDMFHIDVYGKGGHGAAPQGTVDAIIESAAVVTALQTIVSRNKDPLESGVVTCGTINGGFAYNVIADHIKISGTARSFTPATRNLIQCRMGEICCGVAATYGGKIDLNYKNGYPPTVNSHPECVQKVQEAGKVIVGTPRNAMPQKTMGAEDFSYFMLERPGCFIFVGCALPGELRPHHKSVFDFDENSLLISSSLFVQIIRDILCK